MWKPDNNERMAATAWAVGAFLIKFATLGITASLPFYGVWAFVVA